MTDVSVSKPFYRKAWFWGVLVVVVIIFAGSSSNSSQPTKIGQSTIATNTPAALQTPTIFHVGDRVKLDTNVVVVNAVTACKLSNDFLAPSQGKKFVVADVTQENLGDQPASYNAYSFSLQDSQDFSYNMAIGACQEPGFSSGTLSPGQKTRGYIVFELPKDNIPTKLLFAPSWLSQKQIIIQL